MTQALRNFRAIVILFSLCADNLINICCGYQFVQCFECVFLSAMVRILSTDYQHFALVYFCHELENENSCLPGSEGVVILSRTEARDHFRIDSLVEIVPSNCFTKDDFEWMAVQTGVFEIS